MHGEAIIVRGGNGHEVAPNWIRKDPCDEVAGFEIRSPNDSRLGTSACLYVVHAIREGGKARVVVAEESFGGASRVLHVLSIDAVKVFSAKAKDLRDLIEQGKALLDWVVEATVVAIQRTFCEHPEGYALEPLVSPLQKQLDARQRVGRASCVKEVSSGWNRSGRLIKI